MDFRGKSVLFADQLFFLKLLLANNNVPRPVNEYPNCSPSARVLQDQLLFLTSANHACMIQFQQCESGSTFYA